MGVLLTLTTTWVKYSILPLTLWLKCLVSKRCLSHVQGSADWFSPFFWVFRFDPLFVLDNYKIYPTIHNIHRLYPFAYIQIYVNGYNHINIHRSMSHIHNPNFFLFSGEVCVVSGKLEPRILQIKDTSL